MAVTVANHQLGVCTKGTSHVAKNTQDDNCYVDAGHKKWLPFKNDCPSKNLKTGATTDNTFIDGNIVWIDRSVLDACDSGPPHDGTFGGVNSHTYIKYTHATTCTRSTRSSRAASRSARGTGRSRTGPRTGSTTARVA